MSSKETEAVVAELLQLEAEHRRAATSQDVATLAALYGDELTFTHIDGTTQTKADLLAQASGQVSSPLSGLRVTVEALAMRVRVYGEVAVLTGRGATRVEGRDPLTYVVSQVWVKRARSWQLVTWQATWVRSAPA